MTRPGAPLILCLWARVAVAQAPAGEVAIEVVDVAAGRAYLVPGEGAGLRAGQEVVIGGRSFTVTAVTTQHALIDGAAAPPAVGERGSARVVAPEAAVPVAVRPRPRPLATFRAQWPEPRPPALSQRPRPVPLGRTAAARWRLAVGTTGMAAAGSDGARAAVEVGVRVAAEPWRTPIGLDADAALLGWPGAAGGDPRARPPLRVRELRLRWGPAADPRAALGRLPWASVALGTLDGVRLTAPLGHGVAVAGFGGLVPDPIDGRPDARAARFGAELVLDRPGAPWRPRLALAAHGSTWEGALDERRMLATVDVARGRLAGAAHAEVSGVAAGNPWGARRGDLTSAGVDVVAAGADWRLGAGLGLRQPERSLRLAALLPPEWLCLTTPVAGATDEPCAGHHQARLAASAGGGWRRGRVAVDAGGTVIGDPGTGADLSGFTTTRVLMRQRRLELGMEAGTTTFLDWAALRLGGGATLAGGAVDLAAYYRPAALRYLASVSTWVEHRVGADLTWARSAEVELSGTLEAMTGPDVDGILLLWTATWRPSW